MVTSALQVAELEGQIATKHLFSVVNNRIGQIGQVVGPRTV